jgi:hypothetical protein
MEARRSRERAAAQRQVDTLGRQREGQHAANPVKRARGGELVIRLTQVSARSLGVDNPKEAAARNPD